MVEASDEHRSSFFKTKKLKEAVEGLIDKSKIVPKVGTQTTTTSIVDEDTKMSDSMTNTPSTKLGNMTIGTNNK